MTPHVAGNPHEEAARLRKAIKIATALGPEFDKLRRELGHPRFRSDLEPYYEALRTLPKSMWEGLARDLKINPPSEKTIDQVIAILRQRAEADQRDPFEGLP